MKRLTIKSVAGLFIALAASLALADAAFSFDVKGLPGSTWGQVTHDADNGLSGTGVMGFVNQGIDWTTLPGDVVFNTYVEYRYRTRTENRTYYDTQGPAVGLEFKKSFFRLGADYYRERLTALHRSSDSKEIYANVYYEWNLRSSVPWLGAAPALPGSVWAQATYDMSGINGSGAMAFVNQGIDWMTLPGGVVLNTFAEYRYRARTENRTYYDAEGPAVGIEFRKSPFRFGVDYYWEKAPMLHVNSNKFQYYVSWYYDWDLKKLYAR